MKKVSMKFYSSVENCMETAVPQSVIELVRVIKNSLNIESSNRDRDNQTTVTRVHRKGTLCFKTRLKS